MKTQQFNLPELNAGGFVSCPVDGHEDEHPSCHVTINGDRTLFKCFSGCNQDDVITAAIREWGVDTFPVNKAHRTNGKPRKRSVNKQLSPIEPSKPVPRESLMARATAVNEYPLGNRMPCALSVRIDDKDGKKHFEIYHYRDGDTNLPYRGKPTSPKLMPLFRLPHLLKEPEPTVWVTEGEKCVNLMTELGALATTSMNGSGSAGKSDWSTIEGRDVVVLIDKDKAGRKYGDDVASLCLQQDCKVRILELEDIQEGQDVEQWLELHEGEDHLALLEELAEKVKHKQSHGLEIVCVNDVEAETVQWMWPYRFPSAKLSLLVGDPSSGKSFCTMSIASTVSRGDSWVDQRGCKTEAGNVLILASEDAVGDTIRPRLEAAGANLKRIHVIKGVRRDNEEGRSPFDLERDIYLLTEQLRKTPETRLIIIDPLSAYLGTNCDMHRANDVQRILEPLTDLAGEYRTAIIAVLHLNKSAATSKAINRAMGSMSFVGSARAMWVITKDHEDPERRIMCMVKLNNAPNPGSLAFRISSPGVINWEPDVLTITADEALGAPPRDSMRLDEAVEFWREILETGPVRSSVCDLAADEAGISRASRLRGKKNAGVKSKKKSGKDGTHWVCYMEGQKC